MPRGKTESVGIKEQSMNENKIKHLEFIQGIINRMASNSFMIKGWLVTLVAAMFILASKDSDCKYAYIAFVPTIAFWIVDGFYLWQERLFRHLWNEVRKKKEKDIDYSMDTSNHKAKDAWLKVIFSSTLCWFYFPLLAIMVAVLFIMK